VRSTTKRCTVFTFPCCLVVQTTVSCFRCDFKAVQLVQICYLAEKTHRVFFTAELKEKGLENRNLISLLTKEAFEHKKQQSMYCIWPKILMHSSSLIRILLSFQRRAWQLTPVVIRKRSCHSGIVSVEALTTELCYWSALFLKLYFMALRNVISVHTSVWLWNSLSIPVFPQDMISGRGN